LGRKWENAVDARAHGTGRERDWGKGRSMGRGRKRAPEELEGIDSQLSLRHGPQMKKWRRAS